MDILKQMFTAFIVSGLVVIALVLFLYSLDKNAPAPSSGVSSERRVDPMFNEKITGSSPQIVNQYKIGPTMYQIWYEPSSGQYVQFNIDVGW